MVGANGERRMSLSKKRIGNNNMNIRERVCAIIGTATAMGVERGE